jgi:hypothetical protein
MIIDSFLHNQFLKHIYIVSPKIAYEKNIRTCSILLRSNKNSLNPILLIFQKRILMKYLTLLFAIVTFSSSLFAQPENTRWKARLDINGPINVIFDFKKDSAFLYTVADSTMIEFMSYVKTDTSFTLLKIGGQSDCDNITPGKYSFRLDNDTMYIQMITDDCPDRSSVINNSRWTKWKEHIEVKVDEAILQQYTGVYELDDAHPITITFENGRLYAEGPNNRLPKSPLTAEGNNTFFLRIAGVEWDFVKDAGGKVISLISHEEKDYELKKVK